MEWGDRAKLDKVVYSLKGGGLPWAFAYLARFFPQPQAKNGLIAYPSKGRKDHASDLAKEVARLWGYPTVPLLTGTRGKQALRRRKQRQTVAFSPLQRSGQAIHFVDDIVTTGATVRAAYQALGQPSKMTVWSLFYRKDLSR